MLKKYLICLFVFALFFSFFQTSVSADQQSPTSYFINKLQRIGPTIKGLQLGMLYEDALKEIYKELKLNNYTYKELYGDMLDAIIVDDKVFCYIKRGIRGLNNNVTLYHFSYPNALGDFLQIYVENRTKKIVSFFVSREYYSGKKSLEEDGKKIAVDMFNKFGININDADCFGLLMDNFKYEKGDYKFYIYSGLVTIGFFQISWKYFDMDEEGTSVEYILNNQ